VRKLDRKYARISVVIDKELADKLRMIQAEMITKEKSNVSFSFIVNKILGECLRSERQ
jgi:hypothetical protein